MANLLLVTVTRAEAQAVLELFPQTTGRSWLRRVISGKTYYELGQIGGVDAFMVQSEMGAVGPGASVLTVRNALDALHPIAVIMVGIAFGLNPEKQALGDILVSQRIQAYEPQKVKTSAAVPRGDRVTASTQLLDKFRSGDLDWQGPKVHFGLVLSGEKLIDDGEFLERLLALEPEAIGGEMEGAGLYAAANDKKVDWILVKSICDWADGTKNDEYQVIASRTAAAFVLHVLQQGGLAYGSLGAARRVQLTVEGDFGPLDTSRQDDIVSVLAALLKTESEDIRIVQVIR